MIVLEYKQGEKFMSFIIAVHVNEGIVLASDRRTTYSFTQTINNIVETKFGVHTTNNTDKTFICANGAGISTCGDAALLNKPITGYIKNLLREKITSDTKTEDIPSILLNYFNSFSEVPDTHFLVAGYTTCNSGEKRQLLYRVSIKENISNEIDTSSQGADWDGEANTLARLIQNVSIKSEDGKYSDLPYEEISWNYFTLQDAVDFARYAVESTIQTMRFKNMVETVGGSVDILVITPEETKWLQKKILM